MQSNENKINNLADQSYWDEAYSDYELTEDESEDFIKEWIRKYLPANPNGTCFEVGCFPGRFLTFIGRMGYTLNGVDLTPRVTMEFPQWLRSRGLKTGYFYQEDFFNFATEKKFDVVCSFGFIEHFKNWEEVFVRHLLMVNDGGYVIIETPNFRGTVQRLIHYFLDRENYERHYIKSMSPSKWRKICKKHNFKIINHGFIGEFQFWVDKPPTGKFKRKVFLKLLDYYPRLRRLPRNKKLYSPYCGIIAQKQPS
jgi:2-polyprenyl-3-methyl-5-hydroxy-6-metoxy-1,4-benzoquinol methylase